MVPKKIANDEELENHLKIIGFSPLILTTKSNQHKPKQTYRSIYIERKKKRHVLWFKS